jgi:site-specific DNA-methyltransferase (adenine-specific)
LIGTVATNILKHGTGALNIDGCRVAFASDADKASAVPQGRATAKVGALAGGTQNDAERSEFAVSQGAGRWPPNVLLSHSTGCKCVGTQTLAGDLREEEDLGGRRGSGFVDVGAPKGSGKPNAAVYGNEKVPVWACVAGCPVAMLDAQTGTGAARFFPQLNYEEADSSPFFYCAKAARKERNEGVVANTHPTVKPIALMQWLIRLVAPRGTLVLDPFVGSGTTGIAAFREGVNFIGIERETQYFEIAYNRIRHALCGEPLEIE